MNNNKLKILFFSILLLVNTVQATPQLLPAAEDLIQQIDSIRIKQNVPAAAFTLVTSDKTILTHAMGISNRKTRQPLTSDMIIRIGSITKAFTSLAILKLQQQGQLSLNDVLSKYVDDVSLYNPWEKTHPVRMAHLLEHTAGLFDLTKAEFDHNHVTPLSLKQGLLFTDPPRQIYWPPGLHSSYSNVGAGYAAYALEQITQQHYEDFVKESLFKPLHMHRSGFFLNSQTAKHLVTGYDTDGTSVIPYWHMILRPFGGINSTTREMGHFVQMLLNDGVYKGQRIMHADSITRMETPHTTLAAKTKLIYGYGLGNYQHVHRGFLFHGHGGDADGYLSHYAYNRDTGLGYFIVINAFNKPALMTMRNKLENYIIKDHKTAKSKTVMIPVSTLKKLIGTYRAVTHRFPWKNKQWENKINNNEIEIVLLNNKLYSQTSKENRQQLIPVNAQHFRRHNEPVATMAFIEHDGHVFFQADMGNYQRLD